MVRNSCSYHLNVNVINAIILYQVTDCCYSKCGTRY